MVPRCDRRMVFGTSKELKNSRSVVRRTAMFVTLRTCPAATATIVIASESAARRIGSLLIGNLKPGATFGTAKKAMHVTTAIGRAIGGTATASRLQIGFVETGLAGVTGIGCSTAIGGV